MPRLSDLTPATIQDITAADGLYMGNLDGAVMDMILPVPVLVQYLATQNIGGGGGGGGEGGASSLAQITDWPAGVSAEEVAWLDGVTSSIQQQLSGKAASSHGHPLSEITNWPGTVTATHVSYLAGVTSNIQTQITNHGHTVSYNDETRVLTSAGSTATLPIAQGAGHGDADLVNARAGVQSATDKFLSIGGTPELPANFNFNAAPPWAGFTTIGAVDITFSNGRKFRCPAARGDITNRPALMTGDFSVTVLKYGADGRARYIIEPLDAIGARPPMIVRDWDGTAWTEVVVVGSRASAVAGAVPIANIIALTQAQYDAIEIYDVNTKYEIIG